MAQTTFFQPLVWPNAVDVSFDGKNWMQLRENVVDFDPLDAGDVSVAVLTFKFTPLYDGLILWMGGSRNSFMGGDYFLSLAGNWPQVMRNQNMPFLSP